METIILSIVGLLSTLAAIFAFVKMGSAQRQLHEERLRNESLRGLEEASRERLEGVELEAARLARKSYERALEDARNIGEEAALKRLNEVIERVKNAKR